MTWGAIGGAAVSVVGGYLMSKNNKKNSRSANSAAAAMDPYAPYRTAAANQLNQLMKNPSSISDLPEYKARMQAASRLMAAQGYTGSGNALVAAADAGGTAYQQAFSNLAMLSGASGQPGAGALGAAQLKQQSGQNTLQGYSDVANSLVYAGQNLWNHYQGQQAWNTPIDTGSAAPTQDFSGMGYTAPDVSTNVQSPNFAPVGIST